MKEQITIFYNKDTKHPRDYIVKKVLTEQDGYYSIISYFNINGKLKGFPSRLKLDSSNLKKYLLLCRKEPFFYKIERQFIMGGI